MLSYSGAVERANAPQLLTTQPMEPVAMAATTIPARKPISTLDLAWAAGFLEGEGSFLNYSSPNVTAAQVQREPLERLERLFGGSMGRRITRGFNNNPIWVWKANARRSIEIMMTLYVLMSPKRQGEIAAAVKKWRAGRLLKSHGTDLCGRGHDLVGDNIVLVAGKYRNCRKCKNDSRRAWRAKRRAAGLPYA